MNKGLFVRGFLSAQLKNYEVPDMERKHEIIKDWNHSLQTKNVDQLSEQSLKSEFLVDIFKTVLGYDGWAGKTDWTINIEKSTELDATKPDASLGLFHDHDSIVLGVVEVKGPAVDLDEKQKRADKRSPVEQAFSYQYKHSYCEWVIVTNFKEIRLYSGKSIVNYERFFLEDLAEDIPLFEKFCFLFSAENLVKEMKKERTSQISKLYARSIEFMKFLAQSMRIFTDHRLEEREAQEKMTAKIIQKLKKAEHTLGDFVQVENGYIPNSDLLVHRFNSGEWKAGRLIQTDYTQAKFADFRKCLSLTVKSDQLTPGYVFEFLTSMLASQWRLEQMNNGEATDYSQMVPTDIRRIPFELPSKERLELVTEKARNRLLINTIYNEKREEILLQFPYDSYGTEMKKLVVKASRGFEFDMQRIFDEEGKHFSKEDKLFMVEIWNELEILKRERGRALTRASVQCNGLILDAYNLKHEEKRMILNPGARLSSIAQTK